MGALRQWPAHGSKRVPWRQRSRGGNRDDRMVREVVVALPPMIAEQELVMSSPLLAEAEAALAAITALDLEHSDDLGALAALLLRTESVASSRIELIDAGIDDYARAMYGSKANSSATSMVAATAATDLFVAQLSGSQSITNEVMLQAHSTLMSDDAAEKEYAGRWRDMQNWIGGSHFSPRDALYVPPPPELVEDYMRDLVTYVNRDDVPVLAQAAIAHAQFESIHPFTDGNGRIGRALINAVLRRRGTTSRVVVPLASALVADRAAYFGALGAYRAGDIAPLLSAFARGSVVAAQEARMTGQRIRDIRAEWHELIGSMRRGSAVWQILPSLLENPVITADSVTTKLGINSSSAYAAIERLHSVGIVRGLTDRKRNQIWGAASVLDELESLSERIIRRSGDLRASG